MKTVTVYLASTKVNDESITVMFDSNGYFGINDLKTIFQTEENKPGTNEPGTIFWRKAHESNIRK